MYYADKSAIINNITAKDTYLSNCKLFDAVTIGDRSRISNTTLDEHVIIQRGNLIRDSHIGRFTSTMHDTTIFSAEVGSFCSISWSVSIGGSRSWI